MLREAKACWEVTAEGRSTSGTMVRKTWRGGGGFIDGRERSKRRAIEGNWAIEREGRRVWVAHWLSAHSNTANTAPSCGPRGRPAVIGKSYRRGHNSWRQLLLTGVCFLPDFINFAQTVLYLSSLARGFAALPVVK